MLACLDYYSEEILSHLVASDSPLQTQTAKNYSTFPWPKKKATCNVNIFSRLL